MTALARVSDDLLLAAQSGDRHALTQLLVALQPDITLRPAASVRMRGTEER